jgi:HSP20 family molecular chaperone IbpA
MSDEPMRGIREFGESAATAVLERVGRGMSRVQEKRPLSHDLLESDDAYLVVFDAPGAESSDVQVRYLDGEVQVQIDRFREFHEGFDTVFPGRGLSLDGAAPLPEDARVDAEAASATLADDGTLRVRVPKRADESAGEVTVVDEEGPERVAVDADATDDHADDATDDHADDATDDHADDDHADDDHADDATDDHATDDHADDA